ncbi:hypothetical protein Gasu_22190 isoform 1 [Galdieria sulphuraria]|uniref:Ubiquitin-like domain-containing protein n=1 Tax=Galdieria sulphuraria TaxID=130081 RepID=M2Y3Z7_GALSU|nr:hypothetical protein Gasu_22190 isoform 1 [Galdieria sulphuraria]EME30549.1 hypothetical protein isoform 1 [Galdieria sulphuraria]|eukprot:XP_005707069.1 hypothetical protein isoform 1 [Galdieria sulphuraria]
MQLRIGLPDGSVSTIQVDQDATIDQLKDKVCQERKIDPKTKRIRLIYSGKLLSEGSSRLVDSKIEDGSYVHCVISDEVNVTSAGRTSNNQERSERLQTRIPVVDPHSEYRGLDRLREAGFTEDEIAVLRRQFARSQGLNPDHLEETGDLRDLEERWMADASTHEITVGDLEGGAFTDESVFGESEGTVHDFVFGLLVGFLLGIIVLVFLLDRGLPRKRKLGILAGVVGNLLFGILRSTWLMTHEQDPSSGRSGE